MHVFATRLLSRHEAAPTGLRFAALCQRDRLPAEMRERVDVWLVQHGVPPLAWVTARLADQQVALQARIDASIGDEAGEARLRLEHVQGRFGLDGLETALLLGAVAPHLDGHVGERYQLL